MRRNSRTAQSASKRIPRILNYAANNKDNRDANSVRRNVYGT